MIKLYKLLKSMFYYFHSGGCRFLFFVLGYITSYLPLDESPALFLCQSIAPTLGREWSTEHATVGVAFLRLRV